MPPHAPNVDQQQSHEGQRKGFRHLSRDEKVQILTLLGQGFSGRKIAAVIGHDVTLSVGWRRSGRHPNRWIGRLEAVDHVLLPRLMTEHLYVMCKTTGLPLRPTCRSCQYLKNCRLEPYAGGSLSLVNLTPIGQPTNHSSRNLTE